MRKGDTSLVAFTVLSQWGVGIVLCLAGISVVESSAAKTGPGLATPLIFALLLTVTATTVSFLHLGNPVNAPKAMRNLATSWLSREILAIGLFTLCLLAALVSAWISGSASIPGYLLLASSMAGLFLVWAMARVYRIPTIPSWNSGFTLLGFVSASLSLGVVTCLLFDAGGVFSLAVLARTFLTGLLITVLVLEIGAGFVNQFRLAGLETGINGPTFGHGFLHRLFLARMAVTFLACLVLLFLASHPEHSAETAGTAWLYVVAGLVLLQEFAGRVLFYSSYFRIGM